MTQAAIRFGRYELRSAARQLLVDGRPVPIGARAFDLLIELVERDGRVVSKTELLNAVWPGLVVEENNLQVQVSTLRKVLGAEAIATIPARGYRFTLTCTDDSLPPTAIGEAGSTLIGRGDDLEQLRELLRDHRLVTVLGMAGVGKTALARAAAQSADARHGRVAWVELAPLNGAESIAPAIARGLQLPLAGGDADAALLAAVRPIEALLVLDNAEHLLELLAPRVARLLDAAPSLRVLITSQTPLRIQREWLMRLQPLDCPDLEAPAEVAGQHSAVALFVQQAHATGTGFVLDESNAKIVVNICRRLDGVALAIKLAAARLPLLGLSGLQSALAKGLPVLRGGARDEVDDRHLTLRAAFEWSHALLAPAEQTLFRRLAVFVGGFTLELAFVVCGDGDEATLLDALGALVDRSFVVAEDGANAPRYRLLETARDDAWGRLEASGERDLVARRHALALLERLERAYDAAWDSPHPLEVWGPLQPERDNVRAAVVRWATADPALALRLCGAALPLFALAALHEARALTDGLVGSVDASTAPDIAAPFWRLRCVALQDHDRAGSAAAALHAVEQFRRGGDPRRRIGALSTAIVIASLPAAVKATLLEEMRALCAAGGPPHLRVTLRFCEAEVARARGDLQAARAAALEAIDASPPGTSHAQMCRHVAAVELELGRVDDALLHAREAERLMEPGGVSGLLYVLPTLIGSLIAAQELDTARVTLAHALALSRRAGWWRLTDIARRGALLAAAEGRSEDAKVVLEWLSLHSPADPLTDPVEAAAQSKAESALEPFKATLLTPDPPDEAMLCECMLRLCPR